LGPAGSYATDPAGRTQHAGQQFPVAAFDRFAMQAVPRWTGNDAATQAAYDVLVRQVGPCVIVAHSQGCNFAFTAALANPDLVQAVVAIEPSGSPPPDHVGVATLTSVPHLMVWGDFLDAHPEWPGNIMKSPAAWHAALCAAGGRSDWLDLPSVGVRGNSHMLMMDTNSDQIAYTSGSPHAD
jgi:pimeloyl-ACP methyl ester carboxylesterase